MHLLFSLMVLNNNAYSLVSQSIIMDRFSPRKKAIFPLSLVKIITYTAANYNAVRPKMGQHKYPESANSLEEINNLQ